MEWEEYFPDGIAMVVGAKQRIEGEDKPIRYINGRYKLCGENNRLIQPRVVAQYLFICISHKAILQWCETLFLVKG